MEEGDSMDTFLIEIKDLKEQLIAIGEELPDSSLVNTILDGLPDSYQSFSSTFRLMTQGNQNAIKFDVLVTILLQEDKSKKTRLKSRLQIKHLLLLKGVMQVTPLRVVSQKLRLPRVAISLKRLLKR